MSTIKDQFKNQNIRNEWLNGLIPKNLEKDKRTWKPVQMGCRLNCFKKRNDPNNLPIYSSGNIKIHLRRGLLYVDNIARTPLPDYVTADSRCRALFGEDIYGLISKHWQVKHGKERGELYEVKHGDHTYRIIHVEGQELCVFKKMHIKNEKDSWYQLQNVALLPYNYKTQS